MKLIKIFGIVLGLHAFVIGSLFVLLGCSTTSKEDHTREPPASATGGDGYVSKSTPTGELHPDFNAGIPVSPSYSGRTGRYPPTRPKGIPGTASEDASSGVLEPLRGAGADILMTDYTVRSGDSLWAIAKRHGVSFQALLDVNGFDRRTTVYAGQEILIPGGERMADEELELAPSLDDLEGRGLYTIKQGDTLSRIARRFGTTVASIRRDNNLSSDIIYAGQTIYLPVGVSELGDEEAMLIDLPLQMAGAGEDFHTVSSGETPSGIAQRYGMSTKELMRINDIADPRKLRVGQTLIVTKKESDTSARRALVDRREGELGITETSVPMAPEIEPLIELPPSLERGNVEDEEYDADEDIPVIPIELEDDDGQ